MDVFSRNIEEFNGCCLGIFVGAMPLTPSANILFKDVPKDQRYDILGEAFRSAKEGGVAVDFGIPLTPLRVTIIIPDIL